MSVHHGMEDHDQHLQQGSNYPPGIGNFNPMVMPPPQVTMSPCVSGGGVDSCPPPMFSNIFPPQGSAPPPGMNPYMGPFPPGSHQQFMTPPPPHLPQFDGINLPPPLLPKGMGDMMPGAFLPHQHHQTIPTLEGENWKLVPPFNSGPNAQPPITRTPKPNGCKTLFIGGLPKKLVENIREGEDILREIFGRIDLIKDLRLNARQFAHIRFSSEDAVDRALWFSGSKLFCTGTTAGVGGVSPETGASESSKETVSRLHIDFADNREDRREWEDAMRAKLDQTRSSSPEPVVNFSITEAEQLLERIKVDSEFPHVMQVLRAWLDRGEVNRRAVTLFYSLIQSVYQHSRRLQGEHTLQEVELNRAKAIYHAAVQEMLRQMDLIKGIFEAASKQKCWDHFTKPQRKNLTAWKKSVQEMIERESNACLSSRHEDEMEVSDDDEDKDNTREGNSHSSIQPAGAEETVWNRNSMTSSSSPPLGVKRSRLESGQSTFDSEVSKNRMVLLEAQNYSLQRKVTDLETSLAEMNKAALTTQLSPSALAGTSTESEATTASLPSKDASLEAAVSKQQKEKESLETTRQLEEAKGQLSNLKKLADERARTNDQLSAEVFELKQTITQLQSRDLNSPNDGTTTSSTKSNHRPLGDNSTTSDGNNKVQLSQEELKYVGIVITFLLVHPLGASTDYIWSYLTQLGYQLRPREVEDLLDRLPTCFLLTTVGVGAKIDRRWTFTGLSAVSTT